MLLFRPFLVWARDNQSPVKIAGDAAAKFERSEDVVYRWAQHRAIGDALARHFDHLLQASIATAEAHAGGDLPDDAPLIAEVLELVNLPISTAAPVERETRDEAWLRRAFEHANRLLFSITDRPALVAPAPETVPE